MMAIDGFWAKALITPQEKNKREREEWKRESNPTKLWGICERVSEVFSPINREISVVLLLVERGCNSHIT